jgi:hypothetical protein
MDRKFITEIHEWNLEIKARMKAKKRLIRELALKDEYIEALQDDIKILLGDDEAEKENVRFIHSLIKKVNDSIFGTTSHT